MLHNSWGARTPGIKQEHALRMIASKYNKASQKRKTGADRRGAAIRKLAGPWLVRLKAYILQNGALVFASEINFLRKPLISLRNVELTDSRGRGYKRTGNYHLWRAWL